MFYIIKPGTKIDFLGKAPTFVKVSIATFVLALLVIQFHGVNLGLDFAGGHEILLRFAKKDVTAAQVRDTMNKLFTDVDTGVQSFDIPTDPDKTFYLARIERSETFGEQDLATLEGAFKSKYGEAFKSMRYNPEAGDVVQVQFNPDKLAGADLSKAALASVVEGAHHPVRVVRQVGRPEQQRYEIQLKGVDTSLINALKALDPAVSAARVDFVGPTVGKQLRNDGILAVLYAMLFIMVYIALRFDFFYSPGAILCLFHDAVITVAILAMIGEEFTLATIAGLLTLVGYSINDTIVVFDRIRETIGERRKKGEDTKAILNRAINETLSRTVMTSASTLIACLCLLIFGRGTVLASFGMIMTVGIVIGTYSSIYVASPAFMFLRERFGSDESKPQKKGNAQQAVV